MRKVTVLCILALSLLAGGVLTAPSAQAAFGLTEFNMALTGNGGAPATLAGSHPLSITTRFAVNTKFSSQFETNVPDDNLRDLRVKLPVGFSGSVVGIPRCANAEFLILNPDERPECSNNAAVGAVLTHTASGFTENPVYNLVPPPGTVAKLGFWAKNVPVTIEVGIERQQPYAVSSGVIKASQATQIFGAKLELWGVPAADIHDPFRGRCLGGVFGETPPPDFLSKGICESGAPEVPFLTLPRSCQGPLSTTFFADSWQNPGSVLSNGEPNLADPVWVSGASVTPAMEGCAELAFSPTIESRGTSPASESPSGLDFDLNVDDPGFLDPNGRAGSAIEKTVVTLPEGFTTNPSVANGLGACSLSQYEAEALEFDPAVGCPDNAKVGSVEVASPSVEQHLFGQIYVAKQRDNVFGSLLALYMIIRNEELGVLVKQPIKIEPDPRTGQLRSTVSDIPQLPFSNFHLHFRQGPRAPLITPAVCGNYEVAADLYPYAAGVAPVHHTAALTVNQGANGSGCASSPSQLPSTPSFSAGTLDPKAGAYSPFVLNLSRPDGSQQFAQIKTTLPEGLLGKIAGITYCPESGIAQAVSRSGEGQGATELASPSCPGSSEVGTVTVASGAGPEPLYVKGRAYLAGPYKGAPLSLEIITPAIAGPFDLGVVAVRTALQLDLFTSELTAVSDPIPTILHGLPLVVRSISVDMSRKDFTFNPTSCEPKSITGSAISTLGTVTPVNQYFQASGCQKLQYKPKLSLHLKGATKRSGHPALRAVVTVPKKGSYANTAAIQVGLPHSAFLDQGNLDKVCTRPQLASATCPKRSVYGHVKVWTPLVDKPLKGNVYIGVGFGHQLPDLVAELNGQVRLLVHGRIDTTKHEGIRNTFEFVPDAPYSKVVFELKGGKKYGLLENSENICRKEQRAAARFSAYNGRVYTFRPKIGNSCRKGSGGKRKGGRHHKAGNGKHQR